MPFYAYLKAPQKGKFFFKMKIFLKALKRKLTPLFFFLGLFLVFLAVYPLFSYRFLLLQKAREKLKAPIPELSIAEAQGLINPMVAGVFTQKKLSKEEVDYTLINNWFPTASLPPLKKSKITHYNLSIPVLKIENAVVEIGGLEVKDTLIHYPGTALPGEFGNVIIFGHSILPIFYNPKDYKAIFSLIPTLKKGDTIHLYYDGVEYVYEVFDYLEVFPEEINVLEQHFDQKTLSLVTCVPPGTYKKRGIVRARLVM